MLFCLARDGNPDTEGDDAGCRGSRVWDGGGCDIPADPLGNRRSSVFPYLRKEDQKLLAAVSSDVIGVASHTLLDYSSNVRETSIALGMTKSVIELLEVVDVAHQDRGTFGAATVTTELR